MFCLSYVFLLLAVEATEAESDSTSSKTREGNIVDEVHHLLSTPVLVKDDDYEVMYGHEQPAQVLYNSDPSRENAPLDFDFQNKPPHGHEKDGILQDKNERHTISDASDLQTKTYPIGTCVPHSHERGSKLHGYCNAELESSSNEDRDGHCSGDTVNREARTGAQSSLCSTLEPAACKCVTAGKHKYHKLNPSNVHSVAEEERKDTHTLDETNSLSITVGREASENGETGSVQQLGSLNLPYSDSSEEEA